MDTEANDLKVRENRLRRAAVRQGLFLSRRRRRDINARDFGRYALLRGGQAVHGVDAEGFYTLTLDEVEQLLTAPPGGGERPAAVNEPEPVAAQPEPPSRRRGLGSRAQRRGHR